MLKLSGMVACTTTNHHTPTHPPPSKKTKCGKYYMEIFNENYIFYGGEGGGGGGEITVRLTYIPNNQECPIFCNETIPRGTLLSIVFTPLFLYYNKPS